MNYKYILIIFFFVISGCTNYNIDNNKIISLNKNKLSYFKKYIIDFEQLDINNNLTTSIITPDKEIVENTNKLSPAYLIFDNYELILKWNRSLRFALAVCTLKDKFTNEL